MNAATQTASTVPAATTLPAIRVRGRDYTVESFTRTTALGALEAGYTLTGKRGAKYATMRNVNSGKMFLFAHSLSSTAMQGVWLSDATGSLVLVCS